MGLVLLMASIVASDRIDLVDNWRFRHDPHHVGIDQGWHEQAHDDTWWAGMSVGLRWEEQGFPDGDGHGWYRKWVEIPSDWVGKPIWLVVGGVNDACTVYCNGQRINTYGDEHGGDSLYQTTIVANIGQAIKSGGLNLITVDVHDWGGSGGLWRTPCFITADPKQLPLDTVFNTLYVGDDTAQIYLDAMGLGLERGTIALEARYTLDGQSVSAKREAAAGETLAVLDIQLPKGGTPIDVAVFVSAADGAAIPGLETTLTVGKAPFQPWADAYGDLKVLNNFVTELLREPVTQPAEFTFRNPREGWVYFRFAPGSQEPRAFVDDAAEPIAWRVNPDDGAYEAMHKLAAGEHRIRFDQTPPGTLDVRAVPELVYCAYPAKPSIEPYGPYDWDFLRRHVLSHVNTIITHANAPDAHFDRWRAEGRAWLDSSSVPGLYAPEPPAPTEAAAAWAARPGASDPRYAGLIVDEFFWSGSDYYAAWAEAITLLYAEPAFAGHTFYAWCLELHRHGAAKPFLDALLASGGCLAWEKYLIEKKTVNEGWADIARLMVAPYNEWKRDTPNLGSRMMMTLGYMNMPPSGFNHQPGADNQVYKDMQFFVLATDPAFRDLRGLMEFTASAADEEALRWSHQLIRHYCIEGRTDRYTADPYELPHLANPDFVDGLLGWQTYGAVAAETIPGYGFAQGRYPKSGQGDSVCVLSAKDETSSLTQQVQHLEPGRMYCLKVVASNRDALGENRPAPLTIEMDAVERDEARSFSFTYASANVVETLPQPAYFTLHRMVFKATASSLPLTLSVAPGSEPIAVNYVELEPYRE